MESSAPLGLKVDRPPLTFSILFRFFILGLFGLCLFQVLVYIGVSYSSPTLASAIWNLGPGVTFLIALIFRMEKMDIRSSRSVAKLLGTMTAIVGATVFTFYRGPSIFRTIISPNSPKQILLSQPSNWVFGGLIITTGGLFSCIWAVLQTATTIEYPDKQTIVFFYCMFGTLQCIALSPFIEQNRNAWVLRPGIRMIAVVLGGVYSTAFRNSVLTWCLWKKGPIFTAMFSPLSIVIAGIMGVTFLGDSLHLGSVIGAVIIAVGFYMVIWGQTKEKITEVLGDELDVSDQDGSSHQSAPLLSSRIDSNC
ncbi:hypothetical protein QVD17_04658 [Tagetes erecta]|uniref:WAT1-related protein n=1 Tax=Tagetes erecta TaxID=13708 RepID=A0AAD8LGQ2_TARER|nr:hypothetical protein QVD17_04658 [Tagetes erecta]